MIFAITTLLMSNTGSQSKTIMQAITDTDQKVYRNHTSNHI